MCRLACFDIWGRLFCDHANSLLHRWRDAKKLPDLSCLLLRPSSLLLRNEKYEQKGTFRTLQCVPHITFHFFFSFRMRTLRVLAHLWKKRPFWEGGPQSNKLEIFLKDILEKSLLSKASSFCLSQRASVHHTGCPRSKRESGEVAWFI